VAYLNTIDEKSQWATGQGSFSSNIFRVSDMGNIAHREFNRLQKSLNTSFGKFLNCSNNYTAITR